MTITTRDDAIKAAASIARDVAEGKLALSYLERQAVAELTELFGEVVGPGSPVWELQVSTARGVLAAGGIPADELAEWLAVQRASEAPSVPEPEAAPQLISVLGEELSPEIGDLERDALPVAEERAIAVAEPAVRRRVDGYDPLRGWPAGRSGFVS
jgi:hypothetical protein